MHSSFATLAFAPRRYILRMIVWLVVFGSLLAALRVAHAQNPGFYTPQDVRIEQRLQAQLPLDAPFVDEGGRPVTLGSYFGKKPVLMNMIFYRCVGVCTLELEGLVKAFKQMDARPGKDFEVLTVSIDPKESPALA